MFAKEASRCDGEKCECHCSNDVVEAGLCDSDIHYAYNVYRVHGAGIIKILVDLS